MTQVLIQGLDAQVAFNGGGGSMRDSNGTLYTAYYLENPSNTQYVAVGTSTDGGLTWQESLTGSFSNTLDSYVYAVIDSMDVVHLAYCRDNYVLVHRTYTLSGGFSSEDIIRDGTASTDDVVDLTLAVDGQDTVHVVWTGPYLTTPDDNLLYTKQDGAGGWDSVTVIKEVINPNSRCDKPMMAFDSANEIHLVYRYYLWSSDDTYIYYWHYTDHWIGEVLLNTTTGSTAASNNEAPRIVVDSSDNLHVVWEGDDTANPQGIFYSAFTGSWSTPAFLVAGRVLPQITIDTSDNLHLVYNTTGVGDIYYMLYNGSWQAEVKILDASSPSDYSTSNSYSPLYPQIGGVSTHRTTSGYWFVFEDGVSGVGDYLYFFASSDVAFSSPQTQNYSREASASLPSNDANLSSLFTPTEYANVSTVNNIFATQTATDQYAIKLFKDKGNSSSDPIISTWIGKSSIAPSDSTIYLQIYNRNSTTWETVDSDSTTNAGTSFALSVTKTTGLSNYYDGNNWVSFRIYQLAT